MYQALYRKWRPKTFDEVDGQEHVTETLKRQIISGRLSHAYLFVGTRGTGKTSCAKILARAINCQHPENGNPCNKCPSCLGILDGSILDVLELDAASNNGVSDVRDLRDKAFFTPVDVKKRVYIIDEVHMLSTPAFNALLKILEEPPEHLVFILATTEIHKVPATILSRCQRFSFKRILPETIAKRLLYVAGQEKLTLTDDAAALLSRLADGSLRDALSLLDQCASDDVMDYASVLSSLGLVADDEISELFSSALDGNAAESLKLLDKLYADGKVISSLLDELTTLIRDILVEQLMPDGGSGLLSGSFDRSVLKAFAGRATAERLQAMMETVRGASRGLSSGGGKLAAELCLLKLCRPELDDTGAALLSRVSSLENAVAGGGAAMPSAAPAVKPSSEEAPKPAPVPLAVNRPPEPSVPHAAEPAARVPEPADIKSAAPSGKSVSAPAEGGAANAWDEILRLVKDDIDIPQHMFLSDAGNTTAVIDGASVTIRVKDPFSFGIINVPPVTNALIKAASAVLRQNAAVRVINDIGNDEKCGDKLDALSRFSNIKFE